MKSTTAYHLIAIRVAVAVVVCSLTNNYGCWSLVLNTAACLRQPMQKWTNGYYFSSDRTTTLVGPRAARRNSWFPPLQQREHKYYPQTRRLAAAAPMFDDQEKAETLDDGGDIFHDMTPTPPPIQKAVEKQSHSADAAAAATLLFFRNRVLSRRTLMGDTLVKTAVSATAFTSLFYSAVPSVAVAAAPTTQLESEEARRIAIFEKTSPSVVFIDTFTERRDSLTTNIMEVPLGSGSGFVWDKQGHIVTNFHVVQNAQSAQVAVLLSGSDAAAATRTIALSSSSSSNDTYDTFNGKGRNDITVRTKGTPNSYSNGRKSKSGANMVRRLFTAKIVGVDPGKDIAVLKIDADPVFLFPIAVGTSKGVKVGQQAMAIGNPFGLDHTLTSGIISGTGREVRSPIGRPITDVLQTDAAINPGNSGGPLLDSSGRLIGMNTAIYSPTGASAGIGFAIPVDVVKFIVETLIRDGQVVRPVLGISYLGSKQAKTLGINAGVLVLDVPPDSPAAKAGLKGTRRTDTGLIGTYGQYLGK